MWKFLVKLGIRKGDVSKRQQAMMVAMIGTLPGSTKVCKFSSSCHCFYHFPTTSYSPITISGCNKDWRVRNYTYFWRGVVVARCHQCS